MFQKVRQNLRSNPRALTLVVALAIYLTCSVSVFAQGFATYGKSGKAQSTTGTNASQTSSPSSEVGSQIPVSREAFGVGLPAAVVTTISVSDKNGYVSLAKVTVFNENNGKQIANGLTDAGTSLFSFQSTKGTDLIVVVSTSTGYLGSARVTPGVFATIVALQDLTAVRRFCRPASESDSNQKIQEGPQSVGPVPDSSGTQAKLLTPEQIAGGGADSPSRTSVRSFYIDMPAVIAPSPCKIVSINELGIPALDAAPAMPYIAPHPEMWPTAMNQKIQELSSSASSANSSDLTKSTLAIVEWFTFAQIARGRVNQKDRFVFDIPEEMTSEQFFLTILWSQDGEILLAPSLLKNNSQDYFGINGGWPCCPTR